MKRQLFYCLACLLSLSAYSQDNLENLLASGVEDAQRFAGDYISPAAEGLLWNTTTAWIQTAEVKKPLRFEISIIGSATLVKDENKSFTLNTNDYNNIAFQDGSTSKSVATAFGENNPDVIVTTTVENDLGVEEEVSFALPQGLGSANVDLLPTAFLQGRIGIFKATELKVRYFPTIEYDDVETGLVGFGLQHEISQWFPGSDVLPFRLSGLIAYTNTNGTYDFTDSSVIDGENQRFELKQNSYTFQLQASTRLPIINFYGGLGFVTGTSNFDLLGTYTVRDGTPILGNSQTVVDPFSIKNDISGVRATLGFKLQLAFFGLHADYNIAEYNTISAGLHFGI